MDILIIDSNRFDREDIRRSITRPGRDVNADMAVSGMEAQQKMRDNSYDYIFITYTLPDMDGITLLKSIYDEETDSNPCPVIMVFDAGSEAMMLDAFEYGAQEYLIKGNITADAIKLAIFKARTVFDLKMVCKTVETMLENPTLFQKPEEEEANARSIDPTSCDPKQIQG